MSGRLVIVEKILNASRKLGFKTIVPHNPDQFKGMAGEAGVALPETPSVTGHRNRRTAPSAITSKSTLNEAPCGAVGSTPREALGTSIEAWPPFGNKFG